MALTDHGETIRDLERMAASIGAPKDPYVSTVPGSEGEVRQPISGRLNIEGHRTPLERLTEIIDRSPIGKGISPPEEPQEVDPKVKKVAEESKKAFTDTLGEIYSGNAQAAQSRLNEWADRGKAVIKRGGEGLLPDELIRAGDNVAAQANLPTGAPLAPGEGEGGGAVGFGAAGEGVERGGGLEAPQIDMESGQIYFGNTAVPIDDKPAVTQAMQQYYGLMGQMSFAKKEISAAEKRYADTVLNAQKMAQQEKWNESKRRKEAVELVDKRNPFMEEAERDIAIKKTVEFLGSPPKKVTVDRSRVAPMVTAFKKAGVVRLNDAARKALSSRGYSEEEIMRIGKELESGSKG